MTNQVNIIKNLNTEKQESIELKTATRYRKCKMSEETGEGDW